ncbi:hypothetical protein VT84_19995 [Gemmata sp. SH-PL17]|uniref:hypothetical protein n=1 Tax=Gemmata sp. SH-PL17 TaxID=1630693 RepID=UPI00078CF9EF|nr:hypothetical protein [Gemmata sp. SH-PL17]AMV26692.1 hypothetical protein VT84_19995 [Gemmata sp. SH-PL17]
MFSVSLDDISDTRLRRIAEELGVDSAGQKAEVIKAIKDKVSPKKALVLKPDESKNPFTIANVTGIIAVIVASVVLWVNWKGTMNALEKSNTELVKANQDFERKEKESWQIIHIYDIIDRGMQSKSSWSGLTIKEIEVEYQRQVHKEQKIKMTAADLSDDVLRKLLIGMTETGLIIRTIDDKYAVQRALINPRESMEKAQIHTNIQNIVLRFLAIESGKYKVNDLASKMIADNGFPPDDYYICINNLRACKWIAVDDDGKVWDSVHFPGDNKK